MTIKRILAVCDLSAGEAAVIERAGELAGTHGAVLTLMHLPAGSTPVDANASRQLAHAARQLEERLELRIRTAASRAATLEQVADEAGSTDLLVVPHRRERSLAALLRGQPIQRLLRRCPCPVLVVRNMPAARYRRILVAVDFTPLSWLLAGRAAGLEPLARLELFHAVDTRDEAKLRSAEATDEAVRTFRERRRLRALECIERLKADLGTRSREVATTLGRGDAARETARRLEQCGADLLVLGSRQRSAWSEFFAASVSQQVLRWSASDTLIVPQRCLPPSRTTLARRMRDDQARTRRAIAARQESS